MWPTRKTSQIERTNTSSSVMYKLFLTKCNTKIKSKWNVLAVMTYPVEDSSTLHNSSYIQTREYMQYTAHFIYDRVYFK